MSVLFFLCSIHLYFTYNSASHLLYLNSNSVMNIAQPFYPKWLWPFDILYMQRTSSNNLKHCFILSTCTCIVFFSLHNDCVWVAYWIKWWKWNKSIYISRQTSESFRIGWTLRWLSETLFHSPCLGSLPEPLVSMPLSRNQQQ